MLYTFSDHDLTRVAEVAMIMCSSNNCFHTKDKKKASVWDGKYSGK